MTKISDQLPPAGVPLNIRIAGGGVLRFAAIATTGTFRSNESEDVRTNDGRDKLSGFWTGSPDAAGDIAVSPKDEWEVA